MTENRVELVPPPPAATWHWTRILVLLCIFVSGGIVGAVGGSMWTRNRILDMLLHSAKIPDRILPRIKSALQLTDEQARRVEDIVRRRHSLMEALRADAYPKQMAEFSSMRKEVDEVLTSEQRRKWSALCDTIERRFLPAQPVGPPPANMIFYQFDADNDGALAQEEVPPRMWLRLQQADQDADGYVTREEYTNGQP